MEDYGPFTEIWGRIDDLEDDVSEIQQASSVPLVEADRRLAGMLSGIAYALWHIVRQLSTEEQSAFRRTLARRVKEQREKLETASGHRAVAFTEGQIGWLAAILLSTGDTADEVLVQYEIEDVVTFDKIRGLLNPPSAQRPPRE